MSLCMSRRKFLKNASVGSASVAVSAMIPASIAKALSISANTKHGDIRDVEHIVILMQENRSFDHYFGKLAGVRGFAERHPVPTSYGNIWQQKFTDRLIYPYHLDARLGNAQRVNGTPHIYPDAQDAWDFGRMNAWPTHKEKQSMAYYTEAELPFQYALANAFTLCDEYYCSFHGGTNPNRLFLWTGINHHAADPNVPAITNDFSNLGKPSEGYTWKTYPERLEEAGIKWKVYQNLPDNFTDNPLAGFRQYREANAQKGNDLDGKPYPVWAENDNAINPLLKGVSNTMSDDGFLDSLKVDIANGTLPEVSWIISPAEYSEHPGPSSPVQGGWYTQQVLDLLTEDHEVWSKTVFIVNFDENDGFFDHMPPPCAPSIENGIKYGDSTIDTSGEYHSDDHPYGPGPRVPALVISPWSRGGWVNSQVFDHTSIIQFIESRFGVIEENITPFRRAVCGDLQSTLNFTDPNAESLMPLPVINKYDADQIRENQETLPQLDPPSEAEQGFPVTGRGIRPSCALPYELHVNAAVDNADFCINLQMSNTGEQGVVIHVYNMYELDSIPRRYAIGSGENINASWLANESNNEYDLWLLSANGFHRRFKGRCDKTVAATQEISVCYDVTKTDPAIIITLKNQTEKDDELTVDFSLYEKSNVQTYLVTAGTEMEIRQSVKTWANWYDFTVTSKDTGLLRRYCGRIETGLHTYSDPLLGLR